MFCGPRYTTILLTNRQNDYFIEERERKVGHQTLLDSMPRRTCFELVYSPLCVEEALFSIHECYYCRERKKEAKGNGEDEREKLSQNIVPVLFMVIVYHSTIKTSTIGRMHHNYYRNTNTLPQKEQIRILERRVFFN